jgi:PAS domain S-box-containing protein
LPALSAPELTETGGPNPSMIPCLRPMDALRRGALAIAVFSALYVLSEHDYLFFHTVAEGFSIIVASAVFLIAWNSRRFLDNNYLLFLGMSCAFVAGFDALHTLAYKGMGIFPGNSANLSTQLWIIARYLQSISLVAAPLFLKRKLPIVAVFAGFCAVSLLALGSLFVFKNFPDCYVHGGLTQFKIYSEYAICGILLGAIYSLIKSREHFDHTVMTCLTWSMIAFIVSELLFTEYVSVYGFSNFTGHYFKIVSFYLLYKAVVERGLTEPYGVLFRDLNMKSEELRRAKEEWETTFDAVPDLIMILDEEHRVIRANKAMADSLGTQPADMTGKSCYTLVHGFNGPPKFCAHTRVMQDGIAHQKEVYEDRLNGVFSVTCSPLRDREGRLIGSVHVSHDITEEKRSEEKLAQTVSELQKANAETKALLTSARALLEHMDFQESAEIIFQQCKELVGATAGYIALIDRADKANELLFLDPGALVCAVDPRLPMPIRGFRKQVYTTRMAAYENNFAKSNWVDLLPYGHVSLENVLFAPLILAGKTVGLLGLANKPGGFSEEDAGLAFAFAEFAALGLLNSRTLESLEHGEERFRSVFQTANDAIICVDRNGKVVLWNSAAEQIFGYSAEEAIGRSLDLIIPERYRKSHEQSVEQFLLNCAPNYCSGIRVVVGVRKDSTEFPAELSVASWETKEGGYLTAIIRDITERKQSEEALHRTLTELERSNAELQQFAYVASHDLQEPLRMVSSYMQLLERRYKGKLDADADDFITYAVDGAKRMRRLINDLLQYSRVGTHGRPFEPTDCTSVLSAAIDNLEIAIEDTKAQVTYDPLPRVLGDSTQLTQLFQNLIDNALKFRKNAPPLVHVSAQANKDYWLFAVSDNGIGIDPEYSERIFIIFQRLHGREEYSGTGIGLAICKKIVARHGGRIWVESRKDQGTTFFFTVPYERG